MLIVLLCSDLWIYYQFLQIHVISLPIFLKAAILYSKNYEYQTFADKSGICSGSNSPARYLSGSAYMFCINIRLPGERYWAPAIAVTAVQEISMAVCQPWKYCSLMLSRWYVCPTKWVHSFGLLCCGYIISSQWFFTYIYPYLSGLLHCHGGNCMITPVPMK